MIQFFQSITLAEWAFLYILVAWSFGYWSYTKFRLSNNPNYDGVRGWEWLTIIVHSTFIFPIIFAFEISAWNRKRKQHAAILRVVERALRGENCPTEDDDSGFSVSVTRCEREENEKHH